MKTPLLTMILALSLTQDPKQDFAPDSLLKRIELGNAEERATALSTAKQWRERMVPKLVEMASEQETENKRNWVKRAAIEILADLREESATSILVRDIDLEPGPFEDGPVTGRATLYPCAKALVKIGVPAVVEIFSALRSNQEVSGLRLELMVDVLARIYSSSQVAAFAVESEAAKAPDGKANFTKVLEQLKQKK